MGAVPVEPPPTPWDVPAGRLGSTARPRGRRGRPRAGHRAGRLPPRAVPDGRRRPGHARSGQMALVVTRAARRAAPRRPAGHAARCASRASTSRSASTPPSPRSSPAAPTRRAPGGWIDDDIAAAYTELHRLGWAHSVEAWRDGELAGGLYGVAIGGLFAGESMFTRVRDASKVALIGLVDLLTDEHADDRLLDTQWLTPHLATLGVGGDPAPGLPRPARRRAAGCPCPGRSVVEERRASVSRPQTTSGSPRRRPPSGDRRRPSRSCRRRG